VPFTPYHFGPGAAIKAAIPKHFSFTIFCFAQVVTDFETAYYMLRGMYPWHRFFHTYVGATLVGIVGVLIGRPICQFTLRLWAEWPEAPFRRYFPVTASIPLGSAIAGAFIGTYSHVFLDSIMHGDTMPLMPFSAVNPLYRIVGDYTLHLACIAFGLLGALCIACSNRNA
jgi:hypothetical protein